MRVSRRRLVQGLGAALAAAALPLRRARGDGSVERKFLFIFCPGGWDPAWALAPVFGSVATMPDGAVLGSVGGIDFVDNPASPAVKAFFTANAAQSALLHGVEARSVAHDVCLRLILTGSNLPGRDDWPLLLAALGTQPRIMPYVNLSGPVYAGPNVDALVRVGQSGQLASLLDGSATLGADAPVGLPSAASTTAVDAALARRLVRLQTAASAGRAATVAASAALAEERRIALLAQAEDLDLAGGDTLAERAELALECLQRGLSRVAMVEYYGHRGLTWDTHGANTNQGGSYEELFTALSGVVASLEARPGEASATLAEEVCVVVMSEMGRFPTLNSRQGKEHWTYTSTLLFGAGVRGGRSVGGYDAETYLGAPVDLDEGGPGDTPLTPGHLGATLLTLGGHDSAEQLPDEPPIRAVVT